MVVYLCCPQVVSFFHRAMLTVGLAALSIWPLLSGLVGKAKVICNHNYKLINKLQSGKTRKCLAIFHMHYCLSHGK